MRGATLAGIAGSVGLVTNSVTYYYRKKEDLATACFLRSIAVLDGLAQAAAAPADVPARLQDFMRRYARLLADIEEGRHATIVNFNDIRALPSPQAEQVFAAYTDMFRRVRALLQGAADRAPVARRPERPWPHRDLGGALAALVDRALRGGRIPPRRRPRHRHPAARAAGRRALAGTTPIGESAWRLADGAVGPSEAFLRAATILVNEQGYRGASIDKISARLNVTKGSFYHHHDNKHDLISECFERSFAVVREALRLAEDGSGSGWERACAAARALVRYQVSPDGPLLRTTATSALPDQAHRERVRRTLQRLTERMANVVVDGMMDGSIRPLDPAIAAQVAIATINAGAELHRWVPGATAANVADLYVRPAFEGVLCAAA